MKLVIAPDSFKESLTAVEVAAALAEGLEQVLPDAEIVQVPMADGGEGTLAALAVTAGASRHEIQVRGPLGEPLTAQYGVLADGHTAVIEIAQACGLQLVPMSNRNPRMTSSFGVGELIGHCLDRGLRRLLIGLGGSATVDGGAGMLQALGVRFLDRHGNALPPVITGGQLADVAATDWSSLDPRLAEAQVEIACDVDNPLCGPQGAAAVFGPQKGATPPDVRALDEALAKLFDLLQDQRGRRVSMTPGAGAAGGLGAALLLACEATLRPGIDILVEASGLRDLIAGATAVVTGEGRVDAQTLRGKAPAGVARLARACGVPVIAVGGSLESVQALHASGMFDAIEAAVCRPCSLAEALEQAHSNLVNAGIRVGMWLNLAFLPDKPL